MRIRTIKPEFFTHESLFSAEKACKLPLRVAFAGLWCAADREGRFKWEPRRLGVAILPYDNIEFSRVLHALTTRGFVVKYASQGREFGWIPSFTRHQIINNREKPSELPEPSIDEPSDASSTREAREPSRVDHAGKAEGNGREGNKEKEGKDAPAGALDLPAVLDNEEFRTAWTQYLSYRREKRKPLTGMSAEMQIRNLAEMGLTRAVVAIRHSITHGWQGIFEPGASGAPKKSAHAGEYPENIPLPVE